MAENAEYSLTYNSPNRRNRSKPTLVNSAGCRFVQVTAYLTAKLHLSRFVQCYGLAKTPCGAQNWSCSVN